MDDDPRAMRDALSIPGASIVGNMNRRRFLQGSLVTAGAVAFLPACKPAGKLEDGILIVLHFGGGNDGYNTLVPRNESGYNAARSNLAITDPLPITSGFGLHPALPRLQARSAAGKVAMVQGVGQSTVSDLSHFSSIGSWMAGTAGNNRSTGWLGRWLDGVPGSGGGMRGVAMGSSVPLHMVGQQSVVTALDTKGKLFGADRREPYNTSIFDTVSAFGSSPTGKGPWADQLSTAGQSSVQLAGDLNPMFTPKLNDASLTSQLTVVARLINADLGIRVFDVTLGSFDTHDNQAYEHNALMAELDRAVDAFYANLSSAWSSKVALMSFSEFGRRGAANASRGTDHGTSSCMFVIGDNVKGGLYGQHPAFNDLDNRGNGRVHVDYRSVYSSVLQGWMGGNASGVLGANYPDLKLFSRLPGAAAPAAA